MLNSNLYKVTQILPLVICLGIHSKIALAEVANSKSVKVNSADQKSHEKSLPVIDEAFLLFLSEVDVQNGVEVDPLDMLDVNLDNTSKSLVIDVKATEMKQVQKIENLKENK